MTLTDKPLIKFFALTALGAALVYALLAMFGPHVSHAATDPPVPVAGVDWAFWLGLFAALGAALSLFLHWLAPRTKTTLDDKIRDDLDEALAFARKFGAMGSVAPTSSAPPTSTGGAP